jgi:hypothetical protein
MEMDGNSYQPIYDAVCRKISNGNVGDAVQHAIQSLGIDHVARMAGDAIQQAAAEYMRPSAVFRPMLSKDGTAWCALLGSDLQSGIAGFGASPAEAMYEFDKAFVTAEQPK